MTDNIVTVKLTADVSEFEDSIKQTIQNSTSEFEKFVSSIKPEFPKSKASSKPVSTQESSFQMSLAAPLVVTGGTAVAIESAAVRQLIFDILTAAILSVDFNNFSAEKIIENLTPIFQLELPADQKIDLLESKVIEIAKTLVQAQDIIDGIGERPQTTFEGIPLDEEKIKGQLEILKLVLENLDQAREEIENLPKITTPSDVLQIPVNEEFEFNAPPGLEGFSPGVIQIINEFIEKDKQLNNQTREGNKTLNERSQILLDSENTLASANVAQGNFSLGAGLMTDVFMGVAVEAVNAKERLDNFGNTAGDVNSKTEDLTGSAEDLTDTVKDSKKQFDQAGKSIENFDGSTVDLGVSLEKTDEVAQQLGENGLPKIQEGAKVAGDGIVKAAEEGKKGLTSLGVFAADIAANIADDFSDFISTAIKGDFDGIGDLWDNLLDSLQDSIADFAAGLLANPIRIVFEATLNGEEGGIFDLLGGLFGGGKDGEKSTTEPKTPNTGTDVADAAVDAGEQIEEVNSGILSTLSSVVGTIGKVAGIIGTIVALVLSIVNIVAGLLKKKPRLDVDLDQLRDEFGKSTGQAAKVLDFLDDEVANSIINISVKRKAGLGGIGESGIKKQIREAIQTLIGDIQDIINTLPFELAAALNESLLNTSVDIESEIKGDRLLEFDETKDIAEKFEQFINGDLQARFLFAIREFFVGAFEALGVLGSAAQEFIDAEFEKFQGLNREERIEAGKELLQDFQTLTDAFNVLNNNGADSIGATVNSIKNLSNSLDFDAVPSIEELDRGLEELISAAELDPDIIQDYLDLRNAILEAQRAILSSIQSIISSISSLNSIIVDGGGSAFDLTGFINDGLDSVVGLLDQDGLSVEDQEELLNIGTGFLDQLIAEEKAIFDARQAAAQQAADAAAEAQREVIRSQINGLEDEKRLIEENFDLRLEALQEELRIAEEFVRLAESIQKTLDSIILGPNSVFTAVERLNLVQSDIAGLQAELASTIDPTKQLELAGRLEDSLKTLFDLAGEAFGINSPEFVAIFSQVTGGLSDLIDLTGNRARSVEEISAEIETLNIERNEQLERIDAQIENLNTSLSSIQAQNVEATFQASDRVQELAEFFRNEYIDLLEERFEQLGEITGEGFEAEIDALNSIAGFSKATAEFAEAGIEIDSEALIVLRDIQSGIASLGDSVPDTAFGFDIPGFKRGTDGFVDFGSGTLAILHGREAVIPESGFTPFNQLQGAAGDISVEINVNVNGGSSTTVDTLSTKIEDMLVRSIRQGGKLRGAIQDAGAKRLN